MLETGEGLQRQRLSMRLPRSNLRARPLGEEHREGSAVGRPRSVRREASLRGRGASRPWWKAGVQGAGPRTPSASKASTNLAHGGTCPRGPRAAVAPQGDVWKSLPSAGLYLGTGSSQARSVKGRRDPRKEGGPTGTVPCVLVGRRTHGEMEARREGVGCHKLGEAGRVIPAAFAGSLVLPTP